MPTHYGIDRARDRDSDGGTQTVTQSDISDLHAGDRVRVEGARAYRY
jgi:hypothetical protein